MRRGPRRETHRGPPRHHSQFQREVGAVTGNRVETGAYTDARTTEVTAARRVLQVEYAGTRFAVAIFPRMNRPGF
jgi:hypothetical protein